MNQSAFFFYLSIYEQLNQSKSKSAAGAECKHAAQWCLSYTRLKLELIIIFLEPKAKHNGSFKGLGKDMKLFWLRDKIWINNRWCVYAFMWVGSYTILFHGWQYPPVLNAKPRTHPGNEVLMQVPVHSVPEEQAQQQNSFSSKALAPGRCDGKSSSEEIESLGKVKICICAAFLICIRLKTTKRTHSLSSGDTVIVTTQSTYTTLKT